ncbi:MAG: hypothetical protein H9893_06240 [Candidatus Niameybacter stercoravium]|nr:hypothetical protein [Candidatus Niameybacter stercoravium]
MKIALDVVEKVMINHTVVVEVNDDEEADMLVNCDYDEYTTIGDIGGEIESLDYKALKVEKEVITDPDGFEVYSNGEEVEECE